MTMANPDTSPNRLRPDPPVGLMAQPSEKRPDWGQVSDAAIYEALSKVSELGFDVCWLIPAYSRIKLPQIEVHFKDPQNPLAQAYHRRWRRVY